MYKPILRRSLIYVVDDFGRSAIHNYIDTYQCRRKIWKFRGTFKVHVYVIEGLLT